MRKEVNVDVIEDFKSFVDSLEVNVKYNLPSNCQYKWVIIEQEKEFHSKEIYFCWCMEYNYKISGAVGYIHPMTNVANIVSSFKTEKGAKRNFFKRYADYFSSLDKSKKENTNSTTSNF